MKKKCIDCLLELPVDDFYVRSSGSLYTRCKLCYLQDKKERNKNRQHETLSERRCRRCMVIKPASDFHANSSCRGGLSTICKDCAYVDNCKTKYGVDNIDLLIRMRDGKCDICREPFEGKPHIDHDHSCCSSDYTCGKCFRGLLCRDCNLAIGLMRDNPVRLSAAARYLGGSS